MLINCYPDFVCFRFGRVAVGRRRFTNRNHVARRAQHRLPDGNVLPPDAVYQGQGLTGSGQAAQDVSHLQKTSGKRTGQQIVAQTDKCRYVLHTCIIIVLYFSYKSLLCESPKNEIICLTVIYLQLLMLDFYHISLQVIYIYYIYIYVYTCSWCAV